MLKFLEDQRIEMRTHISNKAWETGKVSEYWKIRIIIPILKESDNCCENYRGITLLRVVSKMYEVILERRLITR